MAPTVAWNLRPGPVVAGSRTAVLVHQQSQATQLGVLGVPAAGAQYYGGDCNVGVVRPVVSLVFVESRTFQSAAIDSASLVVDGVAVQSSALVVAAAADPGASAAPDPFVPPASGVRTVTMSELGPDVSTSCTFSGTDPMRFNEAAVAVAALPGGGFIAQYRDPAVLRLSDGGEIQLSAGRAHDSGHALFHEAAGTGSTCAGCHPEGSDDRHVDVRTGLRRTQTVTGGILETAPFRWAGGVRRDGGDGRHVRRSHGRHHAARRRVSAFERWVDPAVRSRRRRRFRYGRRDKNDPGARDGLHHLPTATAHEQRDGRLNTGGRFQVPALYEIVCAHRTSTTDRRNSSRGPSAATSCSPTSSDGSVSFLRCSDGPRARSLVLVAAVIAIARRSRRRRAVTSVDLEFAQAESFLVDDTGARRRREHRTGAGNTHDPRLLTRRGRCASACSSASALSRRRASAPADRSSIQRVHRLPILRALALRSRIAITISAQLRRYRPGGYVVSSSLGSPLARLSLSFDPLATCVPLRGRDRRAVMPLPENDGGAAGFFCSGTPGSSASARRTAESACSAGFGDRDRRVDAR
jgi:hypothetical protein